MGKSKNIASLELEGCTSYAVCGGVDYGLRRGVVPVVWVKEVRSGLESAWLQLSLAVGASVVYQCPPEWLCLLGEETMTFVPYSSLFPLFIENDFDWSVSSGATCSETRRLLEVLRVDGVVLSRSVGVGRLRGWVESVCGDGVELPFTASTLLWSRWEWDRLVGSTMDVDTLGSDLMWYSDLEALGKVDPAARGSVVYEDGLGYFGTDGACLFTDHGDGHAAWVSLFKPVRLGPVLLSWVGAHREFYGPYASRGSKGAYYTPACWVSRSHDLLGSVLGCSWEEEYYIWDCAAGTGNLLRGLHGGCKVFASTLDLCDVETMHSLIDGGVLPLEHSNVFQFDFLNGSFDELPSGLREVVMDPVKRKRLIVYMNPPYVGGGDIRSFRGRRTKASDRSVVFRNRLLERLQKKWGSVPDLYVQFFLRCYEDLSGCVMGVFSPITYISNLNFKVFRSLFRAHYHEGFIVNSKTFDNVSSEFPIAFSVWRMLSDGDGVGDGLVFDVLDGLEGSGFKYQVESGDSMVSLNDSLSNSLDTYSQGVGFLGTKSCVFFQDSMIYVHGTPSKGGFPITLSSWFTVCVYFAVRLCHQWPWWLGREVYRAGDTSWELDDSFKLDCLWFVQTSLQNYFEADTFGLAWYPFVSTDGSFGDSVFVRWSSAGYPHRDSYGLDRLVVDDTLSAESSAARDALKALYDYYFAVSGVVGPTTYYTVRKYFQGVDAASGVMRVKSSDEKYLELQNAVKGANTALGDRIFEKVKGYGFLGASLMGWLNKNKE